jgi:hypothetical protein
MTRLRFPFSSLPTSLIQNYDYIDNKITKMPPKSTTKEATPSSRRSARLAPTSVPAEEKKSNGKKVVSLHSFYDLANRIEISRRGERD